MAHQIENNMLAYAGAVPWHGLGVNVPDGTDGETMLKLAKMDWTVERVCLAQPRIGLNGPVQTREDMDMVNLQNFRSIRRSDTGYVFQLSTDSYQPVQNIQIVDFFREYCEAGHAILETVGAIANGKKVWALARLLGGEATIGHPNGVSDVVKGYMLLATSHDGSIKTIGKATQVRVVCMNTLRAALDGGKAEFSLRHTTKWTDAIKAKAQQQMGLALQSIQQTNSVAQQLANVHIDAVDRLNFVRNLIDADPEKATSEDLGRLGTALLEAMENSPGSNLNSALNTLWGAVNGVTYHVDHVSGRTQDTRLNAAWFGSGDSLKAKALNLAVEMAGITV